MDNNVCISVKVKTNQPGFRITSTGDPITVELKSKPEKNHANLELVKMFTKILKKPVYLISGKKSKNKILKIEKVTKKEVLDTLRELKD
ncbi:MAG: DUF167 family protein [archaeon]